MSRPPKIYGAFVNTLPIREKTKGFFMRNWKGGLLGAVLFLTIVFVGGAIYCPTGVANVREQCDNFRDNVFIVGKFITENIFGMEESNIFPFPDFFYGISIIVTDIIFYFLIGTFIQNIFFRRR